MRRKLLLLAGAGIFGVAFAAMLLAPRFWRAGQTGRSPYVAQQNSPVRGLSAQEVDDLLAGRGAGYARTAELNNYPGPRHVLDLRQELGVTPGQAERIEVVFEQMQAEAKRLGQEIVQRETQLSAAFAGGTISEAAMEAQSEDLALLYGKLRAVHLRAHIQITPLLSAEQIARYNALRGYTSSPTEATPGGHQHGSH